MKNDIAKKIKELHREAKQQVSHYIAGFKKVAAEQSYVYAISAYAEKLGVAEHVERILAEGLEHFADYRLADQPLARFASTLDRYLFEVASSSLGSNGDLDRECRLKAISRVISDLQLYCGLPQVRTRADRIGG